MSNKCFKTKYAATVDNSSLPKLGELVIDFSGSNNYANSKKYVSIVNSINPNTMTVDDGYISTKSDGSDNVGTTTTTTTAFYVNGDSAKLHVPNKYTLTSFDIRNFNDFDASELKYSNNLTTLSIYGGYMDLSYCKYWTKATVFTAHDCSVTGTLSDIADNMPNITKLILTTTNNNDLGDISVLKTLPITHLQLSATYTGTFADLPETILTCVCSKLSGDMADAPASLTYAVISSVSTSVTWTAGKRTGEANSIISTLQVMMCHLDNVDDYLNDMATCSVPTVGVGASQKTIWVRGERTSASDAAVETLTNKGYTVTVAN